MTNIVDETVFVPDAELLEFCLVLLLVDLLDCICSSRSVPPFSSEQGFHGHSQMSFHCPSYPFKMVFFVDKYCNADSRQSPKPSHK
jgi:hypothetical protein